VTGDSSALQVVRDMYEAIDRRDYDAGFALLSDDFEWQEPAQAIHAGTHRGFQHIRERLEAQLEVFDEFTIEPEEFRAKSGRVAVSVRQRARGGMSGAEVEIRIGHLWTIRDGKIARLNVFAARDEALRALDELPQEAESPAGAGSSAMGAAGFEPATSRV
jgi:ketosteroid isomerase-like protein